MMAVRVVFFRIHNTGERFFHDEHITNVDSRSCNGEAARFRALFDSNPLGCRREISMPAANNGRIIFTCQEYQNFESIGAGKRSFPSFSALLLFQLT
jgi:hypothetical protein